MMIKYPYGFDITLACQNAGPYIICMSHEFCDELPVTWIAVNWYDFVHKSFLFLKTSDVCNKFCL